MGGGLGEMGGDKLASSQLAVNRRTKFRNTHCWRKFLQLWTINQGNYFVKLA